MCDVCETTLFNFHWVCNKCGFVVCLNCYKARENGQVKWDESSKIKDEYSWLYCMNKQTHEKEKLMLTQIIAGNSLVGLGILVHKLKDIYHLQEDCRCAFSKKLQKQKLNISCKEVFKTFFKGIGGQKMTNGGTQLTLKDDHNSKNWLSEVNFNNNNKSDDDDNNDFNSFLTLKKLLTKSSNNRSDDDVNNGDCDQNDDNGDDNSSNDENCDKNTKHCKHFELKYFKRKTVPNLFHNFRRPRVMSLKETKDLHPDVHHSWLCDGRLLKLNDPNNVNNITLFQVSRYNFNFNFNFNFFKFN